MLDHIFLTVSYLDRAIAFYEAVLPGLDIDRRHDYAGKDGPPGHPDLKGFGADGRVFFWLRQGIPSPDAVHVGFVAHSEAEVRSAYDVAPAAGATSKIVPGAQDYYDPRYYAAQVNDPDGYSLGVRIQTLAALGLPGRFRPSKTAWSRRRRSRSAP